MEVKQLTKSGFAKMFKSDSNDTYTTIFEKNVWYEQVTIGEVTYRHKLLALKKLSEELLSKKAFEATPSMQSSDLKFQGSVVAHVFNTKNTVYYHLLLGTPSEMEQAKRSVIFFSKCLLPKRPKQLSEKASASFVA